MILKFSILFFFKNMEYTLDKAIKRAHRQLYQLLKLREMMRDYVDDVEDYVDDCEDVDEDCDEDCEDVDEDCEDVDEDCEDVDEDVEEFAITFKTGVITKEDLDKELDEMVEERRKYLKYKNEK